MTCAWCGEPATTQVNLPKGRKLRMLPVCQDHYDMVEREKEERKRERDERALERKQGKKVWW